MADEVGASSASAEGSAPGSQAPVSSGDAFYASADEAPGDESGRDESTPSTQSDPPDEGGESVDASEAQSNSGSQPARPSKAEKRIKQLTAKIKALEAKIAAPAQKAQEPAALQEPKEPSIDDFEDYSEYQGALKKFKEDVAKYAVEKDRLERERAAAEAKNQEEAKKQWEAWDKKVQATKARNPEFDTKSYWEAIQPSQAMDAFFQYSEIGPDVMSALYDDPDEAERIRDLHPIAQVIELDKIARKLSNQIKGLKPKPSGEKGGVPSYVTGGGAAPIKPKSAADVLYG